MCPLDSLRAKLDRDLRIAFVCKGGPENGPFSAMACRIITEKLEEYGYRISAIYTCSGSNPTALLGCVGDYARLCDTWANLTPIDIVGKINKVKTFYRIIRRESILTSQVLGELLRSNSDIDKIFSSKALPIKFPAVDIYSTEYIIFSNKNPGHKKWLIPEGVLGSMALIPFLQPQVITNPEEAGLIESGKSVDNKLLLIDGGFRGNMLLEEAMRDCYDVIFLIDIHGLQSSGMGLDEKYHWGNLIRSALHILSNSNDVRQNQITDRINEEIRIKNELIKLLECLPKESAPILQAIINRMDNGRLKLGDKNESQIIMVSNRERSRLFNFAKFKQEEVLDLMTAGYEAAANALEDLGYRL